ncbi:anti-sigma factor family protein [Planctomicrobium sp. SH527]|uniref:anti-sigma factor family protein n=1 Tax=Planctomicrobium sp. SH527 TaxID=3448123 RepID=UPI003F5AFCE4
MSYSGPFELLSAYVDGELPPQQVAELEKQLENDEGLREQLAELKELSQAIQRLPRQSAPDDLKDSVIEAIQAANRSSVSRPIPLAGPSGKAALNRRWYRSPAAIVGSVLTIGFASVWLPRLWLQNGMDDQKLASHAEMAVLEVQPALMEHAQPMEMAATMSASGGQDAFGFNLPDGADGNAISNADMRPVPVVELTAEQLRQKIAEMGRLPQMGNTIQVPTSIQTDDGEKRIVVVFTVIDVARTLDQLQVLVQNDQIRTLDNRLLSELSPEARTSSISAISLQLDMDGSEMAALLNQVPAVDAMMYLEDGGAIASTSADKEELQTLSISRASVPAAPQLKTQAAPVAAGNDLIQKQSMVQFRFDQLSQKNLALVPSGAAGQQKDNAVAGMAARSMSENALTAPQPGVATVAPPMQPLSAAKPVPQVNGKVGSIPAVSAKSAAAAEHYRAIILIQRAPPVAPAP